MKRNYVDGRFGQVHYWESGGANSLPTLYCLHATAYSGQTFLTLSRRLGGERHLVALDTPGYGGSDAPPTEIAFETYAEAIAESIRAIQPKGAGPVDILGYHTGALLATELSICHPALVRRMILIGVPFFLGDDKVAWKRKLVHTTQLTESFEQFHTRWDYFVTNRAAGLPLERGFEWFVDELRAYPRDWWAHQALFDYRPELRLPLVTTPVRVINPDTPLAPHSRAAAAVMPRASICEVPEVKSAPLELGADLLAQHILSYLSADDASLAG